MGRKQHRTKRLQRGERHRAQRERAQKPLLGFGLVGVAACVALAALVLAVLAGTDLQFLLLQGIDATLGIDAVYWFVTHWMPFQWFAIQGEVFSIATAMGVIVAMRITPIRFRWWHYALVITWGLLASEVWLEGSRLADFLGLPVPTITVAGGSARTWSQGFVGLVSALLAWYLTRSRLVLACWLVASAVLPLRSMISADILPSGASSVGSRVILFLTTSYLLWDLVVIGAILAWAIRSRVARPPAHLCTACGYDLTGNVSGACPECGKGRKMEGGARALE